MVIWHGPVKPAQDVWCSTSVYVQKLAVEYERQLQHSRAPGSPDRVRFRVSAERVCLFCWPAGQCPRFCILQGYQSSQVVFPRLRVYPATVTVQQPWKTLGHALGVMG